MKTTKNVSAFFNIETGGWTIRDNGEVIAKGQGFTSYAKTVVDLEKTANKKVTNRYIER